MISSYWDVIDPIWEKVSIYDGDWVFQDHFKRISPVQRVLLASHWAQSEVVNGGLHQFFCNSTGVLAPEAVTALQKLEMPGCSEAIAAAMKFFGDEYPRDRETRQTALDEYRDANPDKWNPFDEQDDAFYDALESCGGFDAVATIFANRNQA